MLFSYPCRADSVDSDATKSQSQGDSLIKNNSALDSPEKLDISAGIHPYNDDVSDNEYVIHQVQGLPPQLLKVNAKPRASEKLILAVQIITGANAVFWLNSYAFAQAVDDKNAKLYLGVAGLHGLLFIWALSF